MLNNSQIDKLGDRLRRGSRAPADLQLLEAFRQSFLPAHDAVKKSITLGLSCDLSSRASKTQASIVAKLRRSKTRLSRMQDIAGLRLVVNTLAEQEQAINNVAALFSEHRISTPTGSGSGYRAIHMIIDHPIDLSSRMMVRPVELQVRTLSQHYWAQCSEALADIFGQELKYGGAPVDLQDALQYLSSMLAEVEFQGKHSENIVERTQTEQKLAIIRKNVDKSGAEVRLVERLLRRIAQMILGSEYH